MRGTVDLIGSTMKRTAAQKVIQWKSSITGASWFYEAGRNENESIVNVYFVSADEIRKRSENIELVDIVNNVPDKPGIFAPIAWNMLLGL